MTSLRTDEIVVTGLGATTPLGGDVVSTWEAMLAGRSGVRALTDEWATDDLPVRIAARMAVDPTEVLPRVRARRLDRSQQAALVAAAQAWEDAGFKGLAAENGLDPTRVAVVHGTGIGGITSLLVQYDALQAKGPRGVSPLLVPMNMPNGPGAYIGLEIGAKAAVTSVVSACASSAEAIAVALDIMALDRADIVLVGGSEACIHPLTLSGFARMQAMSTRNDEPERASRPFDRDRDGFVLGEGSAMMVLERRRDAEARGATISAVVAGAAVTADSHDIVQPDPEGTGQMRALRGALAASGLDRRDVVHVNAHATSTPAGDMAEQNGIAEVYGEDTVVTSTKSMTGHLLGSAGALESLAVVLAIRDGVVPPTINLENPDPKLRVDVPREARTMDVPAAVNNSFGFGGHNVSVVFRKP